MADAKCPPDEIARLGFDWDSCGGFGDHHDFWTFSRDVVAAAPPNSVIVEIGCYTGRSLTCLGAYARAANKGLRIIGIDNDHIQGNSRCQMNIDRSRLPIHLIQENSVPAAGHFADGECWMAFIDAEHLHESVAADIRAWMPKVSHWLAGHDFLMHTVHQPVVALLRKTLVYDNRWPDIWIAPKCELADADIRTWIPVLPPFTGWRP